MIRNRAFHVPSSPHTREGYRRVFQPSLAFRILLILRALASSALWASILAGTAAGGVSLSADGGYDTGGVVHTLDPETNSPAGRGLLDTRDLRQTFQLPASVDVGEMSISITLNGTTDDLVVRIFEVADVNAATWSAGPMVHSFTVSTGGISSNDNIQVSFSGADVFSLPARNTGTEGYGIELTQAGSTSVGQLRHSNSGTDGYAAGDFYTETGASSGGVSTPRDIGLSISGVIVVTDSDSDGLDDPWEIVHFGNLSQDGTGDPDGDGFDNEAEETAGTDPNDAVVFPGSGAVFYVAPDGDDANPGTFSEPFATIARAQDAVSAGSTVYFRGGTYAIQESEIARYSSVFAYVFDLTKDGSEGNPIRYWAYPGEEPVFDLSAVNPAGYRIYTFHITGDWLHFRGLTVTGVQVNITTHTQSICFENFGSHNLFERLVMHDNQAIGVFIVGGRDNLVLNCDAYRNWDYTSEGGTGGNVDGFGCHYSIGPGNVFRGCRAWLNSDDGYDLINANSAVTIEHCWAAYNGYDYNFVSRGDGNGFKAGGYGKPPGSYPNPVPRHVVRDCLAIGNKQSGFYANHHPGGLDFIGNTALRNRRNFNMLNWSPAAGADVPGYDHYLRNNVGLNATTGNLTDVDLPSCDSSHNQWDLAVTVDASDFESIDESFLTAPRQENGELPVVPLMRLVAGSDLVDAGSMEGEPFAGSAPDLGCYEHDAIEVGNHDFSLPVVSTVAATPAGHVWKFGSDAGVKPDGGGQVAYLGGGGTMEQGFDGFEVGETYHVRLSAAAPAGSADLNLLIDGAPVATRSASGPGYGFLDVAFAATATRHTLQLAGAGSLDEARIASVEITRVSGTSDTDADGLGDGWEFAWFGDLAQEPAGDYDHDGSDHAVEEALGLDPTSAAEAFRSVVTGVGELEWPGAAGINFTVERSTALNGWSDIGTVPGTAPSTTFTDPSPPVGQAFYRVSFTP